MGIDHGKSTLARSSRWDYTPPTILGGNSYLSGIYDRGAIKDLAHTGTSKGLSQAINRGPVRKFLPKYANVYVTIQGHGLSAGVRSHYVTANGVRDGLCVGIDHQVQGAREHMASDVTRVVTPPPLTVTDSCHIQKMIFGYCLLHVFTCWAKSTSDSLND